MIITNFTFAFGDGDSHNFSFPFHHIFKLIICSHIISTLSLHFQHIGWGITWLQQSIFSSFVIYHIFQK